jgi:type IV pilus assembly protein PilX
MRNGKQNQMLDRLGRRGLLVNSKQKGAVMIVALMLLLVMTVLAVSGIGNSVLEQKMSGNYYHAATAFESAEFGLRVAERWLVENVDSKAIVDNWFKTSTSLNGLYTTQDLTTPNTFEVCRGDIDCRFDPRDEDGWCNGGGGCALPKGFVTLGDTLEGTVLDTTDLPVARQPQFFIEHIGAIPDDAIMMGVNVPKATRSSFRITVIGWGQEDVSLHVLQSHVILPFGS